MDDDRKKEGFVRDHALLRHGLAGLAEIAMSAFSGSQHTP